jgi:hypothetical protein
MRTDRKWGVFMKKALFAFVIITFAAATVAVIFFNRAGKPVLDPAKHPELSGATIPSGYLGWKKFSAACTAKSSVKFKIFGFERGESGKNERLLMLLSGDRVRYANHVTESRVSVAIVANIAGDDGKWQKFVAAQSTDDAKEVTENNVAIMESAERAYERMLSRERITTGDLLKCIQDNF